MTRTKKSREELVDGMSEKDGSEPPITPKGRVSLEKQLAQAHARIRELESQCFDIASLVIDARMLSKEIIILEGRMAKLEKRIKPETR